MAVWQCGVLAKIATIRDAISSSTALAHLFGHLLQVNGHWTKLLSGTEAAKAGLLLTAAICKVTGSTAV